ncbi:MAG: hypothetical protein DLM58_04810 [Pseudonocardiales bacterium]|nr:MAG: hypothetical protein DLM58_04810 [Pseudonocardiales bacterium]
MRRALSLSVLPVVALTVAGAISVAPAGAVAAPSERAALGPAAVNRDVTANLFEWNWNSVARECTDILGPGGYGAVQVAPPAESISLPANVPAHPWWEVYQPVSYQLSSRMGNRAQFAAMVSTCHIAGIKVYADAVLNHMTGHTSGTRYGGTTFGDKDAYPNLYSGNDFHHYPNSCPNADDQIHNYDNQRDVQSCQLVELADLNTESDYVRGKLAGYLNDLLSLGVDGFRLDAAKHINATTSQRWRPSCPRSPSSIRKSCPAGRATHPPTRPGATSWSSPTARSSRSSSAAASPTCRPSARPGGWSQLLPR